VFRSVATHGVGIFSGVRVDTDNGDAFRFILLRELFHALIVSVGNGTLHRDENKDGAVFAGERLQRTCGAINVRKREFFNRRANRGGRRNFAGKRRTFDVPLAPRGSGFQERVWRALMKIKFGETRSYGEIAHAIGRPSASRAVGAANGRNPVAIVVPCHRVIGADGSLVGYGGGLDRKRRLLAIEGSAPLALL